MDETQNTGVSPQTETVEPSGDVSPASEVETTSQEVTETSDRPNEVSATESETVESLPVEQTEQARAFQEQRRKIKELESRVAQYESKTTDKPRNESIFRNITSQSSDIQTQVREALSEERAKTLYPQLNEKSEQYDPVFADRVTKMAALSMVENGFALLDEVAKEEAKYYFGKSEAQKVKQETIKQVKEQITAKEQASLAPNAKAPQPIVANAQRRAELQQRAREGDDWALAELLKG